MWKNNGTTWWQSISWTTRQWRQSSFRMFFLRWIYLWRRWFFMFWTALIVAKNAWMYILNLWQSFPAMIRSAPCPVDDKGVLSNRKKYRAKRSLDRQDLRQYFWLGCRNSRFRISWFKKLKEKKIFMNENKSLFETLFEINVNDHIEKKKDLTYLSWPYAWVGHKKMSKIR